MLCMRERVHAQMIVVQTNVHRESTTAQVEGSAKILVTVVATQELKALDFLLRIKAESSQDDIHGSRSISARLVFGNC